jgi:hypothetical protein
MKRLVSILICALLGIAFCLIAISVLGPLLDFSRVSTNPDAYLEQATYSFFVACTGFALLGGWIGNTLASDKKAAQFMFAGLLCGTVFTFAVAYIANTSMRAMLLVFVGWVLSSAVGAWVARTFLRRRRTVRTI